MNASSKSWERNASVSTGTWARSVERSSLDASSRPLVGANGLREEGGARTRLGDRAPEPAWNRQRFEPAPPRPSPPYSAEPRSRCNNCGKTGHWASNCAQPVQSYGVIAFRVRPTDGAIEYLMLCRKHTLGYLDFLRGKYSKHNENYLNNMLLQMTVQEKNALLHSILTPRPDSPPGVIAPLPYKRVADRAWSRVPFSSAPPKSDGMYYSGDAGGAGAGTGASAKVQLLPLLYHSLAHHPIYYHPEWGFPKGRKNKGEEDYDCALREFREETGLSTHLLQPLRNVAPVEEQFLGSNYKFYKHTYYLMYVSYEDSCQAHAQPRPQNTEVSMVAWKTYEDGMRSMREYNYEKRALLDQIHGGLRGLVLGYTAGTRGT